MKPAAAARRAARSRGAPRVRRWPYLLLPWLVLLPLGAAGRAIQAAPETIYSVNIDVDVPDAAPGDGICETFPGNRICTLRGAIQEANAQPDPDTILLPAGLYVLSRVGTDDTALNGDLDITASVTLRGAGRHSAVVDASAIADRVFDVFTATVNLEGLTIRNGSVTQLGGGGIRSGLVAGLTLSDTIVTGNRATGPEPWGGGIVNYGWLTITHSLISSNTAGSATATPLGAGIASAGAVLRLVDSVVSGNTTAGYGGGLYGEDEGLSIINSTFNANQARSGAGLYSSSPNLRLVNSTLSANRASQAGGGLYVGEGTTQLRNVTVTENYANTETSGTFSGGVVAKAPDSTLTLLHSLVAGNFAIDWVGPTLANSDCSGTIAAAGANFVGETQNPCTIVGVAPITGGFARLGPLAGNGGPTATHALLPGSPAIDAGAEAGCSDPLGGPLLVDQRGTRRPLFGEHNRRCDLGAFEYVGPVYLPLVQR